VNALTLDDFDRIVAVNVKGLFVATQEAVRYMGEGGRIINIGSINSDYVPYSGGSLYESRCRWADQGIGARSGPARHHGQQRPARPYDTDMNPASSEFAKQSREYIALQRYADTDEIADFVDYLASAGASFITASLAIDGGYAA